MVTVVAGVHWGCQEAQQPAIGVVVLVGWTYSDHASKRQSGHAHVPISFDGKAKDANDAVVAAVVAAVKATTGVTVAAGDVVVFNPATF
jgi:hypothetical protein